MFQVIRFGAEPTTTEYIINGCVQCIKTVSVESVVEPTVDCETQQEAEKYTETFQEYVICYQDDKLDLNRSYVNAETREMPTTLVDTYVKVAKKIGRIKRNKRQNIGFDPAKLELILKSLFINTSELLDNIVDAIKSLTGWSSTDIYSGLRLLAQKNIVELRQCVQPYQVIRRF